MENKNFGRASLNFTIAYAPTPLIIGGEEVYTNDPAVYHEQGWFDVVITDKPEDTATKIYTPYWRENISDKKVFCYWHEEERPVPDDTIEDIKQRITDLSAASNSQTVIIDTILGQQADMLLDICLLQLGISADELSLI